MLVSLIIFFNFIYFEWDSVCPLKINNNLYILNIVYIVFSTLLKKMQGANFLLSSVNVFDSLKIFQARDYSKLSSILNENTGKGKQH